MPGTPPRPEIHSIPEPAFMVKALLDITDEIAYHYPFQANSLRNITRDIERYVEIRTR